MQAKINTESEQFHDIIQINQTDSYVNLVYKTLNALFWKNRYCKQASWLIKSDTDVMVNAFVMSRFLKNLITDFLCRMNKALRVCRGKRCISKWVVSRNEYPHDFYPPYCDGPAYAVTSRMSANLLSAANKTHPLFIEDAYFTGVLAQRFNPSYTKLGSLLFRTSPNRDIKNSLFIFCDKKKHISCAGAWRRIMLHHNSTF